MSKILEVENLVKDFIVEKGPLKTKKVKVKAVSNVSFFVNEGETLGLVGESGCGKSTLAKLILKLYPATAGEIKYSDKIRQLRKDAQIIFQDPFNSLNPLMSVKRTLREPLIIHRLLNRNNPKGQIKKLLEDVGLDETFLERIPRELSGGQRQRICIARALAVEPRFLVLDECVSSLDVTIQKQILDLLARLKNEYLLTYLFISHNLVVVKNISDRIMVMYLGRIVEIASSYDIFKMPAHPYTELLIRVVREKKAVLNTEISSVSDLPSGCRFNPRCPFKKDVCLIDDPPLREIGPNHFVACHFPLNKV